MVTVYVAVVVSSLPPECMDAQPDMNIAATMQTTMQKLRCVRDRLFFIVFPYEKAAHSPLVVASSLRNFADSASF
jgi:hypothetical protein